MRTQTASNHRDAAQRSRPFPPGMPVSPRGKGHVTATRLRGSFPDAAKRSSRQLTAAAHISVHRIISRKEEVTALVARKRKLNARNRWSSSRRVNGVNTSLGVPNWFWVYAVVTWVKNRFSSGQKWALTWTASSRPAHSEGPAKNDRWSPTLSFLADTRLAPRARCQGVNSDDITIYTHITLWSWYRMNIHFQSAANDTNYHRYKNGGKQNETPNNSKNNNTFHSTSPDLLNGEPARTQTRGQ